MSISFDEIEILDDKSKTLLNSLKVFYEIKKNRKILFEIVSSKSSISLRVLDWFVSNYSKKNDTSFDVKGNVFCVFFQYKARLKSFSKKFFDPFRRGDKIIFKDKVTKEEINTTVGQLNFFKWCIDNKIIDYVKDHISEIESDMNNIQKNSKKESKTENKKEQKRQQLSNSVLKTMNKRVQRIVVDFK